MQFQSASTLYSAAGAAAYAILKWPRSTSYPNRRQKPRYMLVQLGADLVTRQPPWPAAAAPAKIAPYVMRLPNRTDLPLCYSHSHNVPAIMTDILFTILTFINGLHSNTLQINNLQWIFSYVINLFPKLDMGMVGRQTAVLATCIFGSLFSRSGSFDWRLGQYYQLRWIDGRWWPGFRDWNA